MIVVGAVPFPSGSGTAFRPTSATKLVTYSPQMNRRFTRNLLRCCLLAMAGALPAGGQSISDPEMAPFAGNLEWQKDHEQRVRWFREARFGMFIHWGLYSAAGGYWPPDPKNGRRYDQHYAEWIRTWASVPEPEYGRALKPLFQPDPGCTEAWAKLAKEAGMRYAVLTTKHHEGYTLFNSTADYSVDNPVTGSTNISPSGRDLFGEYVGSFRKQGLVPGAYYSLIDWQHPDPARYRSYLHHHLTEIATRYGPVGILWADYSSAGSEGAHWGTRAIFDAWRTHQPAAIFNNRFWNGMENPNADFFTPEKYVPPAGYPGRIFEVCHTLNESFGFSYHDTKWKSPAEVIRLLSDIASKGGNLLLNVGPDAHGRIPDASVQTLRAVGKWLETHGEAIYGTTGSPLRYPPFAGRITLSSGKDGHTLYCHLHEWPGGGLLSLDGLETACTSARLLGSGPVTLQKSSGAATGVRLPAPPPDPSNPVPVVALRLAGPPVFDTSPYPRQAADGSVTLLAPQAVIAPSSTSPQPARVEESHVGFWSDLGDSVWFPFVMRQPFAVDGSGKSGEKIAGRFEVVIDVAIAPDSGGEIEVRLLDQTLRHRLETTAHWRDFHTAKIGTVTLSQAGLLTLHVRPLSIRGIGLMNLRSIKLVPVPPEAGP